MGDISAGQSISVPPETRAIARQSLIRGLALRDLPVEEPFPPIYPQWKTYASFRHVNTLTSSGNELWAATWGGVVRWRFENQGNPIAYTRFGSEHGLPGASFQRIAVDADGRPWVGGSGIGLNYFDGHRWSTFTTGDGLPSNNILCIATDHSGRVWAATDRGLGYIAPSGERLHWWSHSLDAVDLPAQEIQALAFDNGSTLWLGTDWGLYQLSADGTARRFTTQDGLPALQVNCLALVASSRLWIGTISGLCLLTDGKMTSCPDIDVPVWDMAAEPNSEAVWLVTKKEIGRYTLGDSFQCADRHLALPRDAEDRAVALNASGRRWFGYTEGVTQQTPARLLASGDDVDQMTRGENSLSNCILSVQPDAAGRIWVGAPEGLWYLEHGTWRRCRAGNELGEPLTNIRALVLSPNQEDLWIGGWKEGLAGAGLRRMKGTVEVPLVEGVPDLSSVNALTCDTHGRLWVAAETQIYHFDSNQWDSLALPEKASSEAINTVLVDEDSVLWCGMTSGLWRYDGGWHQENVNAAVHALASHGDDLWIGTSAGLKKTSRRSSKHIVDVSGLSDAHVTALAVAQDRGVWCGTTEGLFQIAGEETPKFTTTTYGLADNFVQALTVQDKILWIGTANGLSRYLLTPENTQ